MKLNRLWILGSSMLIFGNVSWAQTPSAAPVGGPPPGRPPMPTAARGPTMEVALEAAQAAQAACMTDKFKVAVVVADSAGNIKVALVGDGAPGELVTFALRKIAVVKEFKQASSQVATQAKDDKELAARIAANSNLFAVPGAVPLKVGDELVGMIAASGAKSEQDEACAIAGADKVKAKLK